MQFRSNLFGVALAAVASSAAAATVTFILDLTVDHEFKVLAELFFRRRTSQ